MLGCLSAQLSRVWTAGKERKCNRGRCLVSCVGGFLVWLIFLGGVSGYRGPTRLSRASLLSGILAGAPFPQGSSPCLAMRLGHVSSAKMTWKPITAVQIARDRAAEGEGVVVLVLHTGQVGLHGKMILESRSKEGE